MESEQDRSIHRKLDNKVTDTFFISMDEQTLRATKDHAFLGGYVPKINFRLANNLYVM